MRVSAILLARAMHCDKANPAGYRDAGERQLTGEIFNAVLVLLVVSSVLSTILAEVFARGIVKDEKVTELATT